MRLFSKASAFSAVLLFGALHADAQSPGAPGPSVQQTVAKIDEYMEAAVRVNGFSGSILVARDGQPIAGKGYGMANYELDVPNSPQTVFRLGSLTKPFTATAIMMLQERGKLKTGDSICAHLSECPAAWQAVTIHHLLTHTSGIPDYTALPENDKTRALPVSHVELVARFKDKPLEFAPGQAFKTSNSGYYLLGMIIERAAAMSYEDFLQANLFKPLGMTSTGYDRNSRVIKNRASGYGVLAGILVNAPYTDMSSPFAAGGLYSTVEDLLRWDRALYTDTLVSRQSVEKIFTPFKSEHGYGWYNRTKHGRRALEQNGSLGGFFSAFTRVPDERVTVIVLANTARANTRAIADDLSAIALDAPYKVPQERKAITLDAKILDKYVGEYQLASGVAVTFTIENGQLTRQVGTQPKVALIAVSETEFFVPGIEQRIAFLTDAQGRVIAYVSRRGAAELRATKIK